jgi:hypothetical protein
VGGAVELDNDFVDCPPIEATDGASAFTVAFWLNTTSRSDSELLLSKYQSGGLFSIELGASGTGDEDDIVVYILTSGSAGYVYTTRNVLSDGTWIHVAVVFDGSQTGNTNRCRIYINGILADTTGSGSIPAALVNSPSDHWYIGWRDNQPANLSLHGKMDEFHLYTRALSQSDIQNSTSKAMAAFCSTARWRILARSSKMRPPTCLPAPTS